MKMKYKTTTFSKLKTLLGFALLAILAFSCQPAAPDSDSASETAALGPDITAMMAPFTPATQTFEVSNKKPSTVTGKAGTKIHVEPKNLMLPNGEPIQGKIKVHLVECTRTSELLGAGLQTVSDGKLLESGGSYYIDMEADGQKLTIKEGKSVAVEFPQVSDKSMELFYGSKDANGRMNWQAADANFEAAKPKPKKAVSDSAFILQTDTVYGYVSGTDTIRSSNINDIFAYIEAEERPSKSRNMKPANGGSKTYDKPANSLAERNRQNELSMQARRAAAEKEEAKKAQAAARQQQIQENQRQQRESVSRVNRLYASMKLNRFGWINCDRFYNEPNLAPVIVELPDTKDPAVVYLVFQTQKSLISLTYNGLEQALQSQNLPVGQAIEVFAMAQSEPGGGYSFAQTHIVVGGDPKVVLHLKPATEAEIRKRFDAI